MSTVTGVHHIAVRAADFDRSIEFYVTTLGLRLHATWTTKAGRAAMVEIVPQSYMEIFERPTAMAGPDPAILHFCLRTDDVDGLVERARAAGYKVPVEPLDLTLDTSIGKVPLRLAYVDGPDGESIELMTSDKF